MRFFILFLTPILWMWQIIKKGNNVHTFCNPHHDYKSAHEAIIEIEEEDAAVAQPLASSVFLTHKIKKEHSILFLHGYTSCPQQFATLGHIFYKHGYNVFIPRMPYHGLNRRLTDKHALLTAELMTKWGNRMVDICHGLGNKVTIVGLSAGGTLASWLSLNRNDLYKVSVISPVFGYGGFPKESTKVLMYSLLLLPNFFRWWHPKRKANIYGAPYVYPRYASKTIAELLRLSFHVRKCIARSTGSTVSTEIYFFVNKMDQSISVEAFEEIISLWKCKSLDGCRIFHFKDSFQLPHDCIDPCHPQQKIEYVYENIVSLLVDKKSDIGEGE